jgi:8-oxo-dGTP pyrophosphatase MutT (NUDIX family)
MKNCELDTFHIGAKALVINHEEKILLLERDHPVKKLYWDLPGGRVHKKESVKEALIRELNEEIGLDDCHEFHPRGMFVTNFRIPIQEESVGLIFSIFECRLLEPFHPVLSSEHINFEWVTSFQAAERLKMHYPEEFIEELDKVFAATRMP